MDSLLAAYLKDISRYAPLTAEEERHLAELGTPEARRKLVEANLRLVVHVVRSYSSRTVDLMDLVQVGNEGLLRAAETYDPEPGARFSTYAYHWIRARISRHLADHSRDVRVPAMSKTRALTIAPEDLTGAKDNRKHLIAAAQCTMVHLDATLGDEGSTLHEVIGGESNEMMATRDQLLRAVQELPPYESLVMVLRFGLGGEPEMDTADVARIVGVTTQQVSRLERQALARLKKKLR